MKSEILAKLEELKQLAIQHDNKEVQAVTCAFMGSVQGNQMPMFCHEVATIVNEKLLPALKNMQAQQN